MPPTLHPSLFPLLPLACLLADVLEMAGEEDTENQTELLLAASGTKIIGVSISLFTIDRFGRRPLLILGSLGCAGGLSMVYVGKKRRGRRRRRRRRRRRNE